MNQEQVLKALGKVMDPELGDNIVRLNMVQNVKIQDQSVSLDLILTTPACPLKSEFQKNITAALKEIGFEKVDVNIGSKVKDTKKKVEGSFIEESAFSGIKNIIPVYSTKGGVGKSMVALNLAASIAQEGAKVALLDLDVYGPSIPRMMNIYEKPVANETKMFPIEKFGMKVVSVGFLMDDPSKALIWRGPLVSSLIKQFYQDVEWGEIDYMVVDLPPGTGDVQITFAQSVPVSGSVFVTTPQSVSIDDTIKGIGMFEQMGIPSLGIIRNMNGFVCPHCGKRSELYPQTQIDDLLMNRGLSLLGDIPMEPQVAAASDEGKPVVLNLPETETAKEIRKTASTVISNLSCRK